MSEELKNVRLLRSTVGEFDLSVSLYLLDENGEDIDSIYDGDNEDAAREWAEEHGYTVIEEDREVVPAYHYDRIERAAKALERYRKSAYGWTDEEFEVWWNKDPDFTQRVTCHGSGFIGTHKEYMFKQAKVVLDAVE